jgi:protoporphyrinogen oxidase
VWTLVHELRLEDEFVAGDLLLSEVFRHAHPPTGEESLAEFVRRKFGDGVLNYLVDPFISTIFFGDARKMGMHSAFPALVEWEQSRGSVVRGAIHAYKRKRAASTKASVAGPSSNGSALTHGELHVTDALPSLGSFKQGMGALVERLAEKLETIFGSGLRSNPSRRTTVVTQENQAGGYCPAAMKSVPRPSSWLSRHMPLQHCSVTACPSCARYSQQSSMLPSAWCLRPLIEDKFVTR